MIIWQVPEIPTLFQPTAKLPGIAIGVKADYRRSVESDISWYSAWLITEERLATSDDEDDTRCNKVLVRLPAFPECLSNEEDLDTVGKELAKAGKSHLYVGLYRAANVFKTVDNGSAAAQQVAGSGHVRRFKYYLVEFDEGLKLSTTDIFAHTGKYRELQATPCPIPYVPNKERPHDTLAELFVIFEAALNRTNSDDG